LQQSKSAAHAHPPSIGAQKPPSPMAIGMQLGGPPPVDPPLVIPPLVIPPVGHMLAFCWPGGAHSMRVGSQTMSVPWYLQQPAPWGSQ
jgi:hypothetical protein